MRALLLIIGIFGSLHCLASSLPLGCDRDQGITSKEGLETAYEKAEVVFLANVEVELVGSEPHIRWKYSLIEPVIKGSLPSVGFLLPSKERCAYPDITENGTYLVLATTSGEAISNKNAVLVVYGPHQVIEEWAVEWAHEKARSKRSRSSPESGAN